MGSLRDGDVGPANGLQLKRSTSQDDVIPSSENRFAGRQMKRRGGRGARRRAGREEGKPTHQVERVARGEGGVDVAEGGGEAEHLELRRAQRHEDGHRVICSAAQGHSRWSVSRPWRTRLRMEEDEGGRMRIVLRTDSGVGVDDDLLPRPLRRRHGSHHTQISMGE